MVSRGLARGLGHRSGVGTLVAVVLLALLAATGCSSDDGGKRREPGPTAVATGDPVLGLQLSFRYQRLGKYGEMDQTLAITSHASIPVTLTARIVPLDKAGHLLRDVRATGVYGTERGNQVLMPGESLDVLVFTGAGATEVRDVEVRDVLATPVDLRVAAKPVEAAVVNGSGFTVATRFATAGVQVTNDNDVELPVQLVLIIWNRPGPGESQQAFKVLELASTKVPAHAKANVVPSASDASTIEKYGLKNAESVKAYVVAGS